MTHKKEYRAWIDDAALGTLKPRRERELLAHTGECDACREAYQHARELAAFVDRGVASLVSGEPSPDFAMRLRARIAEEQPKASYAWLTWKPVRVGVVAVAAMAALAVFVVPTSTNPERTVVRSIGDMGFSLWIKIPALDQNRIRRGYRSSAQRRTVAEPTARSFQHNNAPAEPEVLVPPGQLEAVMQLAADIRSGRIDGKKFIAEQAQAQKNMQKPIDITPIEIKPIEIPPLSTKPAEALSDSTAP